MVVTSSLLGFEDLILVLGQYQIDHKRTTIFIEAAKRQLSQQASVPIQWLSLHTNEHVII